MPQAQTLMVSHFFLCIAATYWLATLARIAARGKYQHRWERNCSALEQVALALLTAGLVFYINHLHMSNGQVLPQDYNYPVSWLLFAWCLNAANLTSELVYGSQLSASFANLWTALSLSFLSRTRPEGFSLFFSSDVQWLNAHRLCFLLGYAFCLLAFPLMLRYFWVSLRSRDPVQLALIDRMSYRMILWALPLLTVGILIEALLHLAHNPFPAPDQLWNERKEALLALATWCICGVYLHSRIFFAWKERRAALLYLGSFLVILAGHLSAIFL